MKEKQTTFFFEQEKTHERTNDQNAPTFLQTFRKNRGTGRG